VCKSTRQARATVDGDADIRDTVKISYYELTDQDLQDLIADLHGVTDVRIPVDRRTGLPRGFDGDADIRDTVKISY
jgi:RNA recognition motif-containing protein